jgi:5,10-methylenetetrahydrofolate reductase
MANIQLIEEASMSLKESLERKRFVVTSEVQPPIDEEPKEIIKRLELVRGRVDGVTVPELEIEGIVTDTVKTCELLKQNRFEAIYQTTTREKNRLQIQKDLLRAHETGVENLLVFTEDYRITQVGKKRAGTGNEGDGADDKDRHRLLLDDTRIRCGIV